MTMKNNTRLKGFTTIETLLALGIIAVTSGISVPMYRNFQVNNDLGLVTEQTVQALRRAQTLSMANELDSAWGFHVATGVLYQGDAYAVRDEEFDEVYSIPTTIATSGLSEVSFSQVGGVPSDTGEIILEALTGARHIIVITKDGVLSTSASEPSVDGGTTSGDTGGTTSGGSTSGDTGGTTSGGSTSGDTGGDSGGSSGDSGGSSGGGGTPTCTDKFSVASDGTITTTGTVDATFTVLGSEITYGANGPEVQVTAYVSTDNGLSWTPLFGGLDIDGGETQKLSNLPSGTKVLIKYNGRYSWFFNKTYISNDGKDHIEVLRNGDTAPAYDAFGNQAALSTFLKDVVSEDGTITIGQYDAVFLGELGTLNSASSDFQDAVVKVTFSQPDGSCATATAPRFRIDNVRLENSGIGDSTKNVYVGESGRVYIENEWIPLKDGDTTIVDNFLTEDVPGIAAWRNNGYVRVLLHGSLPSGSKEIVDANIIFDNAEIVQILNDTGDNQAEAPFDAVVNDGAGGDEVVIAANSGSALFQTRVTVQDDAILVYWKTSTLKDGSTTTTTTTEETTGGDAGGTTGGDTGGTVSSSSDGSTTTTGGDGNSDSGSAENNETPDPCGIPFTIASGGRVIMNKAGDVTFRVRGSHARYGSDTGPEIQTLIQASFDGGVRKQSLFNYNDIDGGERQTFTDVASGTVLSLHAEGRYSWLFRKKAHTGDGTGRVQVLKRWSPVPGTTPYNNSAGIKPFLRSLISDDRIMIGKKSVLVMMELNDLDSSADFQDAVVEIILEKPASAGVCGADSDSNDDGSSSSSGTSSSAGGDTGGTDGGDAVTDPNVEEEQIMICHYPPGNPGNPQTLQVGVSAWNGHSKHGDIKGSCIGDSDGDGILNNADLCPNTYMPEFIPTTGNMYNKRYSLTQDSNIFRTGPRKKIGAFTLADTRGCNCEQMVDVAEGKKEYRFGQYPRLRRQMQSLFPFYTSGARQNGCGQAMMQLVRQF
ncbi:MAG: hypothetical protein O2904_04320 [bacterium]|nr:hypothetical protein [bacterium]